LTVIYLCLLFQIRYYVKMLLSMPFWGIFSKCDFVEHFRFARKGVK
jgi:hypothetical protein